MPYTTGTNCFPTFKDACEYYSQYGCDSLAVSDKIKDGTIKIEVPRIWKQTQRVVLVNEKPGRRYYIKDTPSELVDDPDVLWNLSEY